MSINHFMNKIKGKIGIDSTTLLCLLVIVLVSLSSFGLGRLSVHTEDTNDINILENENLGIVKGGIGESAQVENGIEDVVGSKYKVEGIQKEKMYVASKNGKLYYRVGCSGAKRIREENRVWFASSSDAEKSGYTASSACK